MRAVMKTLGVVAALSASAFAQTSEGGVYYKTSAILAIASEYEGTQSLSPSQFSQLYDDINRYASEFVSAFPTNDPAFTDPVFTKTASSVGALFTAIESADGDAYASGTVGLAELSALVTGLPDASAYLEYGKTLQEAGETWSNGVSRLVVLDVGPVTSAAATTTTSSKTSSSSKGSSTLATTTSIKSSTNSQTAGSSSATNSATSASSSAMAAAPTSGSGVVVGAVVAAAGVIGVALL